MKSKCVYCDDGKWWQRDNVPPPPCGIDCRGHIEDPEKWRIPDDIAMDINGERLLELGKAN